MKRRPRPNRRFELDLEFSARVRHLDHAARQALLIRMNECRQCHTRDIGVPPRDWWLVLPAGGKVRI